jgi:hypothetical protein
MMNLPKTQDVLLPVQNKLNELIGDLHKHDGFGELKLEMRLMRRGQKEVIISCGKTYRYVIDFALSEDDISTEED